VTGVTKRRFLLLRIGSTGHVKRALHSAFTHIQVRSRLRNIGARKVLKRDDCHTGSLANLFILKRQTGAFLPVKPIGRFQTRKDIRDSSHDHDSIPPRAQHRLHVHRRVSHLCGHAKLRGAEL